MKKFAEALSRSEGSASEMFAQAKHVSDLVGMLTRLLFLSLIIGFCGDLIENSKHIFTRIPLEATRVFLSILSIHITMLIARYLFAQTWEWLIHGTSISERGLIARLLVTSTVILLCSGLFVTGFYTTIAIREFAKAQLSGTEKAKGEHIAPAEPTPVLPGPETIIWR